MVGDLMQILEDFRYERPGTFFFGVFGLLGIVCVVVFMLLPPVPILRAIGVTGAQTRMGATVYAVYWQSRALLNAPGDEVPTKEYGNLLGVSPEGRIVVQVAKGEGWERKEYDIADTQPTNLHGVAKIVSELVTSNARIDIYRGNQAVIWIHGEPLNVHFVEAGVAKPDPNPPTNIVDSIFAAYYWSLASGKTKGNEP